MNFEYKNTMLLYPKHNNHIDIQSLKLGIDDKEINLDLKSVDLFCDGVCYGKYCEVIKNRLKEILIKVKI